MSIRSALSLATLAVAAGLTLHGADAREASTTWAVANATVDNLLSSAPALTAGVFKNSGVYIASKDGSGGPAGWEFVRTLYIDSYAELKRMSTAPNPATGKPPAWDPRTRAAKYDNEHWPNTPVEERQNPAEYTKRFCELAHQYGLSCVTAPSPNLAPMQPGYDAKATIWDQYLSMGFPQFSAKYADIYDIQFQRFCKSSAEYAKYVGRAVSQARQANPKIVTISNLSTRHCDAQQMFDSAMAVKNAGYVAGFWLNIPKAEDTPITVSFLEKWLHSKPAHLPH